MLWLDLSELRIDAVRGRRRHCAIAAATAAACLSMIEPPAHATLYWDLTPGAAGGGVTPSGTWSTTDTNWNSDSGGAAGALVAWPSSSTGDAAVFSAGTDATGAYTVTVVGFDHDANPLTPVQIPTTAITLEEGTPTITGDTVGITGANAVTANTTGTISAPVNLNADSTITVATNQSLTLSGALSGSGKLTKSGLGTLTITGAVANAFGALTVSAGTVEFGKTAGTTADTSSITVNSGGTIKLLNSDQIADGKTVAINGVLNLNGNNENLRLTGASSGLVTLNGGTLTFGTTTTSGADGYSGRITGAGSLVMAGTNALGVEQLKNQSGTANDYTGDTTINSGTLRLGGTADLNIPDGPGKGNVVVNGGANGGVFDVFINETINGLTNTAGNTAGVVLTSAAGSPAALTRTLTVGGGDTTATFDGKIQDGNTATGIMAITKIGAGIQSLTNANTYTGATNINGGTLRLHGASLTSNVLINSGTLDGIGGSTTGTVTVGDVDGVNLTPLAGSGHISPGESIGTLATGALKFNADGVFDAEINSTAGTSDLINVTGGLTIDPLSTLNLSDLGSTSLPDGAKLTLIAYSTAWNGMPFAGYADDSTFTLGANTFTIDYNDPTLGGTALTLTAGVPEPTACGLLGLSGLAVLSRRRRSKRV